MLKWLTSRCYEQKHNKIILSGGFGKQNRKFSFTVLCCDPDCGTAHAVLFKTNMKLQAEISVCRYCTAGAGICAWAGNTAVHPVRTHCSITLLCKKGFSAECFQGFSGKNEDILWLSALSGDTRTICASWVHIAVMESTKIWEIDLKKKRRNSVDISLYFVPQSYCDVICKTQPNFFFQEFSESLSFTLTCHHSPTNTCMNSRFHGEPLTHFLAIDSRAQPARFHSFLGVHVQMKRA